VPYQERLDRQDDLRAATLAEFDALDVDAFVYPTANQTPDPIGDEQDGVFTRWSEQTGYPAISVPMGYGADRGLPAGLEFLGTPFGDARLIEIASGYEAASRRRVAPASTPATFVAFPQPPAEPPRPPVPPAPPTPPAPPMRAPPTRAAPRLRVELRRALLRGRSATVTLRLTRRARVSIALRRGRRTVATSPSRSAGPGSRSVTLRLRRAVAPGSYTLVVTAKAGGLTSRDAVRVTVRR
jgi:hypothetical protein